MKLKSLELGRIFLAPLSGVADSPYRRICKRFGADAVYSEMVSSEGLARAQPRSIDYLRFHHEERPIGVQIFGKDPKRMAEAAAMVEEVKPDLIDINMACPSRKIVKRGAGCALMREPEKAGEIAAAVVGATGLPVTAKLRIGWDETSINVLEVARVLEDSGVTALSVHGRTFRQGFAGRSSWDEVARVKQGVGIPVVLSGDVATPEDAERAFDETGCDAVMVGRGTYGRPWIFREILDHLDGRPHAGPGPSEIVRTVLGHLDLGIAEFGERVATVRFRKHLLWYTRGIPRVVALRPSMSTVSTRAEVSGLLDRVFPGTVE
ncbi:MAG: tRNA dihydrouridine synthase DusB [Candidatus Eisenbacteria bacterium]